MLAVPTAQHRLLRAQAAASKLALDAPAGVGTRVDRQLAAAAGPAAASPTTPAIATDASSSVARL
jgi:hypothetical protein